MSKKTEEALWKHHHGYNCAQSVACAFAEELGVDEGQLFALMEGYGFGMGCMSVCGAVSAMSAVVGMMESTGQPGNSSTKKKSYAESKKLHKAFAEKNGSTICRDIKGVDTKKVLRTCDGCVEDAVALVEQYLKEREEETTDGRNE